MATLSPDDIKALEQTRQRLLPLYQSLTALQQNVVEQHPLPSWSALQSHSALISGNLQEVARQLAKHQTLLASTVVFPLPQYPGRTQEHILQQMLRTKLEPNVEDWVDRGQDIARAASKPSSQGLSDEDLSQLWGEAPQVASEQGRKLNYTWGADYTLLEMQAGVENVKTGLKRELVVPEDDEALEDDAEEAEESSEVEEEDDDNDKMDVVEIQSKPDAPGLAYGITTHAVPTQMPLENIFRYMMTGSFNRAAP